MLETRHWNRRTSNEIVPNFKGLLVPLDIKIHVSEKEVTIVGNENKIKSVIPDHIYCLPYCACQKSDV